MSNVPSRLYFYRPMFDSEYFKDLVNETTDLIASRENIPQEDKEELDARIESNKMALKILAEDIEDNETKQMVLARIENMYQTFEEIEIKTHKRNTTKSGHSRVEEDILRGALSLKQKAIELFDDLEFDKKVLGQVGDRMNINLTNTSENIKKINLNGKTISSLTLFVWGILVFFGMYFILRFL